ncbi:NAD(+) synthase [Marinoscillum furvescens]|uniref:Glutamine-dependent NAD(+) synthetase n=1 Tax=Marinoscillum furvescens DSM 4134 TaxID=1122208 RepID=A0A3D9L0E6_MARFU|nr:NAD(+) synthase [Marinoscillum furvescens]RED96649.1 NAD+ synthase (glutamine-hydrolysing) [Marinoscillum furvescens DSM 4134]
MANKKIKVGGACLNQIPINWENNLQNIRSAIAQARDEQIKILCLPELCITGYGCEDLFLSEWLPQKALDKLLTLLPDCSDIAVAVGIPFLYEGHVYNTTAFIAQGEIKGIYAKQKLANDGVHYEPRWFTPWPAGKVVNVSVGEQQIPFGHITITHEGLKIGFEICEDAWREDRPGVHPINHGADLILNPSASHFAFGKANYRENLVIRSSDLLKCTYVYANLLGNESGRMIYDGDILIAQNGELKAKNARLSFKDFKTLGCEIDFEDGANSDTDIRPDVDGATEEFGQAASLALFDYLRKSRAKGFVLSLSGGADSSSIATLVALAVKNGLKELGFDEFNRKLHGQLHQADDWKGLVGQLLYTAYQGTKNSSEDTLNSAKTLAESIGAQFYHWTIDREVAAYTESIEEVLQRKLTWQQDDIALQNIQARARSPIIWMLANIQGCLLLSTSNRSEGDVGYATMDGDTSGSISPIAAVDKQFVLSWLKFAEAQLGFDGLAKVNSLAPTAELRPQDQHQTDEIDLMPYAVLVDIETKAIRDRKSPVEVYNRLKGKWPDHVLLKQWIHKFFRMWSINQWKRERIAPSFHLDDFNVDPRTWCRFPILSSGFKEELDELDKLK